MIIKPYTDSDLLLEPSATDFPALIAAFDYSGVDFDNDTITCPISGVVLSGPTFTDNGNRTFTASTGATTVTGTLTTPSASKILVGIQVNSTLQNGNGSRYGDGYSDDGLYIQNAISYVNVDASNYHTLGALTPTASYAISSCAAGLIVNWAGNATTKLFCDATYNETVVSGVATGTIAAGITTITQAVTLPTGTNKVGGIYLFEFTSAPSNTEVYQAMGWMAANSGYVYPGWRYKT